MKRLCVMCNKEYERQGNNKFCSSECKETYYIVLNDNISKCVICNKELSFKAIKKKNKSCNGSCGSRLAKKNQTPESKATQYKNTSLSYKRKTQTQKDEIQSKRKQTNLKRYGVEHSSQSKDIQDKKKQTNLKRYGVECILTLDEYKDKIKQTNLKRYGVECVLQSKDKRNEASKTSLRLYGKESFTQTDEFIIQGLNAKRLELQNKTNLSNTQEALLKGFQMFSNEEILENRKHINDKNYIIEKCFRNGKYDRFLFYTHFCYSNKKELYYRHKHKLKVNKNVSKTEKDIFNKLVQKYPYLTFKENIRNLIKNPKTQRFLELDIVVKKNDDIVCAIEYNGLYYHNKENPIRENLKTHLCFLQGIELFHIWEDSVENDLEIVYEYLDNF